MLREDAAPGSVRVSRWRGVIQYLITRVVGEGRPATAHPSPQGRTGQVRYVMSSLHYVMCSVRREYLSASCWGALLFAGSLPVTATLHAQTPPSSPGSTVTIPRLTGAIELDGLVDEAVPRAEWRSERDPTNEAGLDIKYSPTSNLALDLTVNTDFAQVEADEQQINLTRFALFFPEKRQTAGQGDLSSENMGVLRLRQQVFNPYSTVGGMLTTRLGSHGGDNVAYGLDAALRLVGDEYLLVQWAHTFDEEAEQAGGLESGLLRGRLERCRDDGFFYYGEAIRAGADYRPGLGFQLRSDFTYGAGQVGYRQYRDADSPLQSRSGCREAPSCGAWSTRRRGVSTGAAASASHSARPGLLPATWSSKPATRSTDSNSRTGGSAPPPTSRARSLTPRSTPASR